MFRAGRVFGLPDVLHMFLRSTTEAATADA
jgi:hypothetical protein